MGRRFALLAGLTSLALIGGALSVVKLAKAAAANGDSYSYGRTAPTNDDISNADDPSRKDVQRPSCCENRSKDLKPYVFVSTLDGRVSAIDTSVTGESGGRQVWTLQTDSEPLLSSNLDDTTINEHGHRLIPSLDGQFYLYGYNGENSFIESAPFDVDALLSGSLRLGATVLVGAKHTRSFFVNYNTGRVYQTCDASGCHQLGDESTPPPFPRLIIKRTTQTVRGVNPTSGAEIWNATVGDHELLLDDREENADPSGFCICLDDDDHFGQPNSHPSHSDTQDDWSSTELENIDLKLLLPDGVVSAYDKRDPNSILWEEKLGSPIVQVWVLTPDGQLKERSIFDHTLVPAFSYYSDEEDPDSARLTSRMVGADEERLIYIGTYDNQKYIIRSAEERQMMKLRQYRNDASRLLLRAGANSQPQLGHAASVDKRCADDCPTCSSEEVNALILHNQYPRDMGWYLYKHKTLPQLPFDKRGLLADHSSPTSRRHRFLLFLDTMPSGQFAVLVTLLIGLFCIPWLVVFCRTRREEVPQRVSSDASRTPQTETTHLTPTLSHESSADLSGRSYGRFTGDFDPIRQLGRGGFGIVIESRNKHDDQLYAVKRIAFAIKKNAKERVRREVKALAQLDHPGIVRYFSAWFEEPPAQWQKEADREMFQKCQRSLDDEVNLDDAPNSGAIEGRPGKDATGSSLGPVGPSGDAWGENGDENGFTLASEESAEDGPVAAGYQKLWKGSDSEEDTAEQLLPKVTALSRPPQDSVEIIFAHSTSAAGPASSPTSVLTKRKKRKSSSSKPSSTKIDEESGEQNERDGAETVQTAYLYIQMQLCRGTLKDWLMENNRADQRDQSTMLDWFDQLICAMHYVHHLGLVHRDLKPSNIFFSTTGVLKIGDFGLVTAATRAATVSANTNLSLPAVSSGDHSNLAASFLDTASSNRVGTQLYMSPEQEAGKKCTSKADIFALGLILIELLVPFTTLMERVRVIQEARGNIFPHSVKECPEEYELISQLLSHDPACRPACSDIRQNKLFQECWAVRPLCDNSTLASRHLSNDSGRYSRPASVGEQ